VQKGPNYLRDKNILELGSGTGLVGLAAGVLAEAAQGIWITDQASVNFLLLFPSSIPVLTFNTIFYLLY